MPLVSCLAQVHQYPHKTRIAAHVQPFQPQHVLQCDAMGQGTGADHLHAVLKQPHLDARALDGIVTVQDGVEHRLTPGKIRVLRNLVKAGAQQAGRTL